MTKYSSSFLSSHLSLCSACAPRPIGVLPGGHPNTFDTAARIRIRISEFVQPVATNSHIRTYFTRGLNCLAQGPAGWFTLEYVGYKFILGSVHDERTILDVPADAQKAQIPNSTLGHWAAVCTACNDTDHTGRHRHIRVHPGVWGCFCHHGIDCFIDDIHSSRLIDFESAQILCLQHLLGLLHRRWKWLSCKTNEMLICWSFRSPGLVNFLRWRTHRRFSVGRSVGRVAAPPRSKLLKESPLKPLDDPSSCNERSIMMRLQMSRKVLAITRAAVSHRNTWHMWILVRRSRATYAKSLKDRKSINFSNSPQYRTIVSCIPLSDRGDASVYIQHVTRTMASMEDNEKKGHSNVVKYGECCEYLTHLPLSLPTPQTRIVWIGWVFNTVKFSGSISFKAPSSKSMNRSLPWN